MKRNLDKLIDNKKRFYDEITKSCILDVLENENISILKGFVNNIDNVRLFYEKVYSNIRKNPIVFCGINPGRNGAGITGVSFFDNTSLSKIITSVIDDNNPEPSANFIWNVISTYGKEIFFKNVYLTNICWFGFIKSGKNFNYHELPESIQSKFFEGFIEEMESVQPHIIVPLGKKVYNDLIKMKQNDIFNWNISDRLNHPRWCNYPSRINLWTENYIKIINKYKL